MNMSINIETILFVSMVLSLFAAFHFVTTRTGSKKGVRLWSRKLSDGQILFLKMLKNDSTYKGKYVSTIRDYMIVKNDEVIISRIKGNYRTITPICAYINLRNEVPKIEFRGSLLSYLFPLAFLVLFIMLNTITSYLFALLIILVLIDSARVQKNLIIRFIENIMSETVL